MTRDAGRAAYRAALVVAHMGGDPMAMASDLDRRYGPEAAEYMLTVLDARRGGGDLAAQWSRRQRAEARSGGTTR